MDELIGGLIGIAVAAGARALFSGSSSELPDLCPEIGYVRGVPYGRCDSMVFRGAIEDIPVDPSEAAVVIHLLNGDNFIRSTDDLNKDKDGDFVASSDLIWDGQRARFEALVSAEALGNVRSYRPLTVQVTGVHREGAFTRSRFNFKDPSGLLRNGPTPTINAIAWHMLLVARAGRPLAPNDLKGMIDRVTDYFSLSRKGRRQFQEAVKEQTRSHQSTSEMSEIYARVFDDSLFLDHKIRDMLSAMVLGEVVNRDEFHTSEHAHILRCLASLCSDDDLRHDLRRLASAIEQDIGAAGAQKAAKEEERARHCEVLGVPIDASPEQIKRAYREAMKEVHPDLTRNLMPRQRKVLEQHAREINEAMDFLSRD